MAMKRPRKWTEARHQRELASYLDVLQLPWFHVPNEGRRSRRTGAEAVRQGLKAGVPDVMIVRAFTYEGQAYHGLAIELKRPAAPGRPRGRLTPAQRRWGQTLEREGWMFRVEYGWADAADTVDACYGGGVR